MVDSDMIYRRANGLVKQCGTRDPERIADDLGILVMHMEGNPSLLGMYTFRWNHRIILLNRLLSYELKKMVLAHELGHDQCHRNLAKNDGMREFTLFGMKNHTEYDANAFASHILLDNGHIYDLARQGYTAAQIAQITHTDTNLVLIKAHEMSKLGYELSAPLEADGKFMGKIKLTGECAMSKP